MMTEIVRTTNLLSVSCCELPERILHLLDGVLKENVLAQRRVLLGNRGQPLCSRVRQETEATIDSIEVAEFESHAALKEWLSKKASAFAR